ncbi:PKD domain-containing protein [uncultured Vibrio sp.]|uniref:PKD domain-containing protein n=1 Tax=uncultured Vibrio sp. TaxID=114054 RepID=UPI0026010AC4|nr:PKD domain-containing protein [uncultured Vibrio sp.]
MNRYFNTTPEIIRKITLMSIILLCQLFSIAYAAQENRPPFPNVELPERVQGIAAVTALGDKLPDVAAWYGKSVPEFIRMIKMDPSIWIDRSGRMLIIETKPVYSESPEEGAEVSQGAFPDSQTFLLHSRPGSDRVIYLDFTGDSNITNTAWNQDYGNFNATPFDLDGSPNTFSSSEHTAIQRVWQMVAEDYAPFDVDVTTQDPGVDNIMRDSSGDSVYGTRVVITRDFTAGPNACNCGGFAYVGVFDYYPGFRSAGWYKPAFVFYDNLSNSAKNIAEATSHEAGHNLGLSHDGGPGTSYYWGHNATGSSPGWAPIMGVGYNQPVVQWSKGDYYGANNTEDDLNVIDSFGAKLIVDGNNSLASAELIDGVSDGSIVTINSVSRSIESRDDIDYYEIQSGAGNLNITVSPFVESPNLDILATLYDSNGVLLASFDLGPQLAANISNFPVSLDSYYLAIEGTGVGSPTSSSPSGYTDYGSLGNYTISGSYPDTGGVMEPTANATATPSSGGYPLSVIFDGSASVANEEGTTITSYEWDFGDGNVITGATPSHTYDEPNNYTATLTVTDSNGNSDSDSTTIIVTNADPIAIAVATPNPVVEGETVNFDGSASSDPDEAHDNVVLNYDWDFGDGNGSTSMSPTHAYQSTGNFTASLTVTDNYGASSMDSVVVSVTSDPALTLLKAELRIRENISAANAKGGNGKGGGNGGGGNDGGGDGETGSSYTVTATVTDNNGDGDPIHRAEVSAQWQWGSNTQNVTGKTNKRGVVSFTSSTIPAGEGITLTVTDIAKSGYSFGGSTSVSSP